MADERIHPRQDSPPESALVKVPSNPQPTPGTYVIQVPKDQIYRVPPPENAKKYKHLSSGKPPRSACRCCLCSLLGVLLALIALAGLAALIFYLVFRPESPNYSIQSMKIKGFNLTSSRPLSPQFDVTVKANNPNDKLGIYYRTGSSINVYYDDIKLGTGVWPVFYQGKNNVTIFTTSLKESGIALTTAIHEKLADGQRNGTVPFKLKLRVPVRIKVGSVKTWRITVKVDCDIAVNNLTENAKIENKSCDYGVKIW